MEVKPITLLMIQTYLEGMECNTPVIYLSKAKYI